jgi:urea transport system permease protein
VYGTLLVNFGKTYFSESFPDLWLFLMAALFIGVVMAFPNGLAGLYESHVKPWLAAPGWRKASASVRAAPADTPGIAPPRPSGQAPCPAGPGRARHVRLNRTRSTDMSNSRLRARRSKT